MTTIDEVEAEGQKRSTKHAAFEFLENATTFTFGEVHASLRNTKTPEHAWAVVSSVGRVWSRTHGWVYEPLPSSRTEEFIADTRFTRMEAIGRAMFLHERRTQIAAENEE